MKQKRIHITKRNKNDLVKKANSLCNAGVPLAQVKQRCRLSYFQLKNLNKDESWDHKVLFRQGYKTSPVWVSHLYTQKLREFAYRQYLMGDMSVAQIAWLIGRSHRTVYRYIEKGKQQN